jgi:CheY-like chemotaxis protein
MATILIIEDSKLARNLLKRMLKSFGHEAVTANNGEEGVALFKEQKENIDLILLDMMMPVMDGETALPLLKKINPNISVIIISGGGEGYIGEKIKILEKTHKGTGVLPKPYGIEDIKLMLEKYL